MTTAQQLVDAASAANWSSFNALVTSATPVDIAAIGSDWDTVMSAIGMGVGTNAQAPKGLFTNAMNHFFEAASPYLTGDSVAAALVTIADYSTFPPTDHLSVEMIAIMKAVPASVAATASTDSVSNILFHLASNQSNPDVTPAELKNTYAALTSKFAAHIDADAVMFTVSVLASNNGTYPPTDQLPSVRVLLEAAPTNPNIYSLQNALNGISLARYNPEITPAELNGTLKVFTAKYGDQLTVEMVLGTASSFASIHDADYLACVRTLLELKPADAASANRYDLQNTLDHIAMNSNNSEVTPSELNASFKAYLSTYGAFTDVNVIVDTATALVGGFSFPPVDNLASVRTLLAAEPANAAEADPITLSNFLLNAAFSTNNPEITPAELNSTFAVFLNHYGAATNVNDILGTVAQLASSDTYGITDNTASLRTLLAAHPDNVAEVDPFYVGFALQSINGTTQNPLISEHEVSGTIIKLMATYGAVIFTSDLVNAISFDTQSGKFEVASAIVNHMTATQFTDAAPDVDSFTTAKLLTTGDDTFSGAASDKLAVFGGAGKDVIDFSANTSTDSRYLDGGAGKDTLTCGLGDDMLSGGAGDDVLKGGLGADTFRFSGGGLDHVTDFNVAQGDRIDLHDVLHFEGSAIADFVILTQVGGNTIVSVDADGAGSAHGPVQVAQLDSITGLDVNALYANGQIIA